MTQLLAQKKLTVRGRSASRCAAEVEHDPQTQWSARCSIGMEHMVSAHGHASIEAAIAELNESLARHGLSVSVE